MYMYTHYIHIIYSYSVSLQPILTKSDILTVCGSPRLHNFMQNNRITYNKENTTVHCLFISLLLFYTTSASHKKLI